MLANTLTINTGDVRVLTKINQDAYGSVFLLKATGREYRLRISHSKTKATASKPSMDRHNVELIESIYATTTVAAYERKFYFVIEQLPSDTNVANPIAIANLMIAEGSQFLVDLQGWQS